MTTKKYRPTIYGGNMRRTVGTNKYKAVIHCDGMYDGTVIEYEYESNAKANPNFKPKFKYEIDDPTGRGAWKKAIELLYEMIDKNRSVKKSEVPKKSRLTLNFKHEIAQNVISVISEGHDTFGKIRGVLYYTDRELKAGIRYGLSNWIHKSRIYKDKKTYFVETL